MYDLISRFLFRIKRALIVLNDRFERFAMYRVSRNEARNLRKRLIKIRGYKIVNRPLKAEIKRYCRETFGSSAYWPWLALYTEMRGEFIEGWIPDDVYRFEILPKVNPEIFASLSDAKSMDHKLFPGITVEPHLTRIRGEYIDRRGNVLDEDQVREYLINLNREIVIKPDNGRQGKGILFLHSRHIRIDELPADSDLVFQEVARQHKSLREVYPHSVNTFRVLTHMEKRGEVAVKFINLRFGTEKNRVDNVSCGGIWISVKMNGEVSSSAYDEFGLEAGEHHPDTGYRFKELRIPFVDDIIACCKVAHKSYPYVGLVGWDVYVNESGRPIILEWNAKNPWFWDIDAQFGPLFLGK
ncbi:sugar-transfer associated ATP-grasp domain-containing protein [Rhodohalobacter barkolensis]|uniref:Alpha-L-glutamate ligase-related protein ATP-grasp domain-containing protein n=1 Tax=Rhodohalobacter barkolensis TaxID=2053187 RepID=A0A2N0VGE2_9BACT|nr:sugar-transfer associated ATP-grasp domain-containing protein [Rhodohalobacter barkolensis]PKD43257.1 hypothetical protein CWD77_11625 [Rhodohalobacter barkolensis]